MGSYQLALIDKESIKLHETPVYNSRRTYLHSCAATMELNELLRFKSPLLLPLLSVVFKEIYVKKSRGWCNFPQKIAFVKPFWLFELLSMSFNLVKFH